jgi:hypothetical protein
MCCRLPDGAVVVRSLDPELQLQGLRAALGLALGDRPARLFLVGPGVAVLAAAAETEAGRCLVALREARIPVLVPDGAGSGGAGVEVWPEAQLLEAIEAASFQQTF